MKRVATRVLNRNLPEVTELLHDHVYEFDGNSTDVYVIEAGSDANKPSKYTTLYDPEVAVKERSYN